MFLEDRLNYTAVLLPHEFLPDLDPFDKWFLGIRVVRDRTQRKIWLCQDSYIEKLAQKFGINQSISGPATPMSTEPLLPYTGIATESEIKGYQQKTGSVTYSSTISRPDNAQASKAPAEANKNPGPQHAAAVLRDLRYLVGTKYLALELGTLEDLALVFNVALDASSRTTSQLDESQKARSFSCLAELSTGHPRSRQQ
jgi:hypothetical protein